MSDPIRRIKEWKEIEKTKHKYSDWHRKALPRWCYMTDGDWFERRTRDGEIKSVAYIETIGVPAPTVDNADKDYSPWGAKRELCIEIEKKMGIPAYIVWHNKDCDDFLVLRVTETTPKRMNEKEYINFIEKL